MTRRASAEDFELFWTTRRDGFRTYSEQAFGPWDDAKQRENAERDFLECNIEIIERDGESIGYQIVERHDDHWFLEEIALIASERGRGLGTELIRELLRSAGSLPIRLNCLRVNPARHLYERLGFRTVASEEVRVRMECP